MSLAEVHNVAGAVDLVLLIAGALAIIGGLWRAWERDFVPAAVLIIAGIVVIAAVA